MQQSADVNYIHSAFLESKRYHDLMPRSTRQAIFISPEGRSLLPRKWQEGKKQIVGLACIVIGSEVVGSTIIRWEHLHTCRLGNDQSLCISLSVVTTIDNAVLQQ